MAIIKIGSQGLASGTAVNTPAFEATISASKTLTENQYTKIQFT